MASDGAGCISVAFGRGDGTLEPARSYATDPGASATLHMPRSLASADLDGDGLLDLVASGLQRHAIWVLWGQPNGDFDGPQPLLYDPEKTTSTTWDYADSPICSRSARKERSSSDCRIPPIQCRSHRQDPLTAVPVM